MCKKKKMYTTKSKCILVFPYIILPIKIVCVKIIYSLLINIPIKYSTNRSIIIIITTVSCK